MNPKKDYVKIPIQVVLSGVTILLVITSVSLLHTNQYEFIYLRFSGLNMLKVSYFDTILYASYLTAGILIGILADRLGKRKIFLIIGSSGSSLFFYLMTRAPVYWALLGCRFCQGAFTVMEWQILMTLVLDYASNQNRGKCVGIFGVFLAVSMGVGPFLGGIIAKRGIFFPYYAAAVLNMLVLLVTIFLIEEPSNLKRKPSLSESFNILKTRSALVIPAIFNFIDRLHIGFIIFILPLYIQIVLGQGPEMRGRILGIHALSFILLQYPIGKLSDRYGRYTFLIPGSMGYGLLLSVAGYIGAAGLGVLAGLFFALGIFSGLTGPPNAALVGDLVNPEENGMAVAFFNFSGNIGIVFGPMLAGIVTDLGSFALCFVVAGIVELVSLGMCLLLIRKLHRPLRFPSFQYLCTKDRKEIHSAGKQNDI